MFRKAFLTVALAAVVLGGVAMTSTSAEAAAPVARSQRTFARSHGRAYHRGYRHQRGHRAYRGYRHGRGYGHRGYRHGHRRGQHAWYGFRW